MRLSKIAFVPLLLGTALLAACPKDGAPKPLSSCDRCGVVESIVPREIKGEATPAGTVAGAVIGGVIGHQFGGNSRSRDAATAAGAVGGAFAGREIEKQAKKKLVYDITVRMDRGEVRTLTKPTDLGLRQGDHVEVNGTELVRA